MHYFKLSNGDDIISECEATHNGYILSRPMAVREIYHPVNGVGLALVPWNPMTELCGAEYKYPLDANHVITSLEIKSEKVYEQYKEACEKVDKFILEKTTPEPTKEQDPATPDLLFIRPPKGKIN